MRIELTGPTCSGKSQYITKNKILSVKISLRFSILGLIALTIKKPKALFFLLSRIVHSDLSLYHVLRICLNVFAKIGHFYFGSKDKDYWVDEGLSHIPFILMFNTKDLHAFLKMFSHEFNQMHIFFTVSSPEKISACLKWRGHKRVKSDSDFERFISNHVRLMNQYYSLLDSSGFKVTQFET